LQSRGSDPAERWRQHLVIIRSVILQNATQLRLVERHQVIERFAPDRTDEALDVAVLARRARTIASAGVNISTAEVKSAGNLTIACGHPFRRSWMIADPHCATAMCVG
jgi:hypothetical protein